MKKFVATVIVVISLIYSFRFLRYNTEFIDGFFKEPKIETNIRVNNKKIEIKRDGEFEEFEIRGVNLSASIPGKWPSDNAISKDTYLRWFREIQALGANTIRIYTVYNADFYEALFEFNKDNDNPLYLIQGVWVSDYKQNSHLDAHDADFKKSFIKECKNTVNVIHGNAFTNAGYNKDYTNFDKDVSKWVLGYIVGSEWRESTVVYTNNIRKNIEPYKGKYIEALDEASPFESMLAEVQDKLISYETKKYNEQRLVSFSNWNSTDPFVYPSVITGSYPKIACINADNIVPLDKFKAGYFVSYHLYTHYPDYYEFEKVGDTYVYDRYDDNAYKKYVEKLNEFHSYPVIVAEYGVSSGRGISIKNTLSDKTSGHLNEFMQGEAIIDSYKDIMDAGCSGSILYTWQDEWQKTTPNTIYGTDENKTIYWSDAQTDDQFYGLLSFDPGKEESTCYVDGDIKEWSDNDIVSGDKDLNISIKYDEKYIYFKAHKEDYNPDNDIIYIPIDITPKSGSTYCENFDVKFDRQADFLIIIDGMDNSRMMVQERYNSLDAMFSHEIYNEDAFVDPPSVNSPVFNDIKSLLKTNMDPVVSSLDRNEYAKTFSTGLLEYGNANPDSEKFNSLADFCFKDDDIEIKIPWGLLNFSNPSEMKIHDDYYLNYGVEDISVKELYAGIGVDGMDERIKSDSFKLKGWGDNITYHERLKKSYYMLKDYWEELEKEKN